MRTELLLDEERVAVLLPEDEERVTCWAPELLLRDDELVLDTVPLLLERVAEEVAFAPDELLRVVCWVEVDLEDPLVVRVCANISCAVTRDRAISTDAAIVIERLIASNFFKNIDNTYLTVL